MKDLLPKNMKAKAEILQTYSHVAKPDQYQEHVDFAGILRQVTAERKLRRLARAIGFSHSMLHKISVTGGEPRWSVGVRILKWVRENMK